MKLLHINVGKFRQLGKKRWDSPGSEPWDKRPGLLTLAERKSGDEFSTLLPCSGVLCLRAAWLGPFSELGNLRTVRDLSSLRPSSSDELFNRGWEGMRVKGGSENSLVLIQSTLQYTYCKNTVKNILSFWASPLGAEEEEPLAWGLTWNGDIIFRKT